MGIEIQASVYNDRGRIRGNNEDNFYLNGLSLQRGALDDGAALSAACGDDFQVYAVCDGMGGTDAGEEASLSVVTELSKALNKGKDLSDPEKLKAFLQSVSDSIYNESERKQRKSGTTIAMVVFSEGHAIVVNVGDSRIYRLRDGALEQISLDHSKVQRLISMGLLAKEEVKTHPERHVITQYLGMPSEVKVAPYFKYEKELRVDDIWLLCSDGLTDMLDDQEIERFLLQGKPVAETAKQLMTTALARGGHDNVTVMVLKTVKAGNQGKKNKPLDKKPQTTNKKPVSADKTIEYPDRPRQKSQGKASQALVGDKTKISKILTVIQYVLEAAFIAFAIDLIYYLMS